MKTGETAELAEEVTMDGSTKGFPHNKRCFRDLAYVLSGQKYVPWIEGPLDTERSLAVFELLRRLFSDGLCPYPTPRSNFLRDAYSAVAPKSFCRQPRSVCSGPCSSFDQCIDT